MLARGITVGKHVLGGALAFAVAAGVIALVAPLAAAEFTGGSSYQIRDDAMAPALLAGDWVLAEGLPREGLPPRGSILAYEAPDDRGTYRVRRLIGLPGERVQIRGGAVYIDGTRAGMTRVADRTIRRRPPARHEPMPRCINDPVEPDGDCRQEQWRETLPDGTATLVLNSQGKVGALRLGGTPTADDTRVFRIPKGSVFLLGDNRDGSLDSRAEFHGMVPLANIRHRVWMIHTSLDKSSRFAYPRFGRFFRRVA